eukprot:12696402-Prorocentrum_lima.AAC.1
MKQQLKDMKLPSPSKNDVTYQQDQQEVRRGELYLPKSTQDEVSTSFEHGFVNPAAGGLKSVPGSGEAILECLQ